MSDVQTAVHVWSKERDRKHAEIMRLADEYADESRSLQVGLPSVKRGELHDALWKVL